MMNPAAFTPAAPAGRAATAPLQSAPSMGFGKAELVGAHGWLTCARQSCCSLARRALVEPRGSTPTVCVPEAHFYPPVVTQRSRRSRTRLSATGTRLAWLTCRSGTRMRRL